MEDRLLDRRLNIKEHYIVLFLVFALSLNTCVAADTWWNMSFKYRVPLQINETNGFNRTNDTVVTHIEFSPAAYGTSETSNSLRLLEYNGSHELETPFHVYNLEMFNSTHFTGADIVFMVSFSSVCCGITKLMRTTTGRQ